MEFSVWRSLSEFDFHGLESVKLQEFVAATDPNSENRKPLIYICLKVVDEVSNWVNIREDPFCQSRYHQYQ